MFPSLWNLGSSNTGWNPDIVKAKYVGAEGRLGWLVKTFQERRTWFAMYLAYYRVFTFHIIWFNVLMGLSFAEDTDFRGRWWVGISSAAITHAVLETAYVAAMVFVRGRVPPPPAGQADIREQIATTSTWGGAITALCCCCLPRRARGKLGVRVNRALTEQEEKLKGLNALWTVGRASAVSGAGGINSAGRLVWQLLAWVLCTVALTFLFLAQFSWFPWPEDEPGDPNPFRIGDRKPADFFRECAPLAAAPPSAC